MIKLGVPLAAMRKSPRSISRTALAVTRSRSSSRRLRSAGWRCAARAARRRTAACARTSPRHAARATAGVVVLGPARVSTPVAWMWPSGSVRSRRPARPAGAPALDRRSVASSVMSTPDSSRYRKLSPARSRLMPGCADRCASGPHRGRRRCVYAHQSPHLPGHWSRRGDAALYVRTNWPPMIFPSRAARPPALGRPAQPDEADREGGEEHHQRTAGTAAWAVASSRPLRPAPATSAHSAATCRLLLSPCPWPGLASEPTSDVSVPVR